MSESEWVYEPKVNETQEFIEISNDFSNPLDIVREAISNAYDAKANEIHLKFHVVKISGEPVFKIEITDNGHGMNKEQLESFYDLGNSTRIKGDPETIGEKGHGTKVYLNSKRILVTTVQNGKMHVGEMLEPYKDLHDGIKPKATIKLSETQNKNGTKIEIWGYNNNRRERFTHDNLKDHIQWFTKHGAFDVIYSECKHKNVKLYLQGLEKSSEELIEYGHYFPSDSQSLDNLLKTHLAKAPDYYCKKIIRSFNLKSHPEISVQAIFSIEGKYVKYGYNNMLRRSGYSAPSGSYTAQERYGLWLCKDYMPIQRKNEWITFKGQEYTRLQAFVNCQDFRLTANRGSIENTPTELLQDLEASVRALFNEIVESDDWTNLEYLETEVDAFRTIEKERKSFEWRKKRINKANVAKYKGHTLVEPNRESGVLSLFLILSVLNPDLFPFQILDYDTHEGYDVIVKGDKTTPISMAKLFFVEFKHLLSGTFNHSFENLHSIVCWDTEIKHDEIVKDIANESRKLTINAPSGPGECTTYFLDDTRKPTRIQVYVLKDYLKEKLGLDFRPRSASDCV